MNMGLSAGLIQNLNPAEQYYGPCAVRYTHTNQESVEGTGFVMEYKKVNTNNLSLLGVHARQRIYKGSRQLERPAEDYWVSYNLRWVL